MMTDINGHELSPVSLGEGWRARGLKGWDGVSTPARARTFVLDSRSAVGAPVSVLTSRITSVVGRPSKADHVRCNSVSQAIPQPAALLRSQNVPS